MPGGVLLWLQIALMACGLIFWAGLPFAKQTSLRLVEGKGWLGWRPLPHDMGRMLIRGLAVSIILQMLVLGAWPGFEGTPLVVQVALTLLMYQGLLVAVIYWHLGRVNIPEHEVLGTSAGYGWHDFSWGIVGYTMTFPVVWVASLISEGLFRLAGQEFMPQELVVQVQTDGNTFNNLMLLVMIGFIGPFLEEVIFRGILFPLLARQFGLWAGLLLQAVLFGFMHRHLHSLLPLSALAVVLGLQYMYTRRLMTCVWTHVLFNTLTLVMTLPMFQSGGS